MAAASTDKPADIRGKMTRIVGSLSKTKAELIGAALLDANIIIQPELEEIQAAPTSMKTASILVGFLTKKGQPGADAFVKALRSVEESSLADELQGIISGGNQEAQPKKSEQRSDSSEQKDGQISAEKKKIQEQLSGAVIKETPNVKWDDVAGLKDAKMSLEEAVILPISHPQIFMGDRKAWSGILLFGPPGTGKSHLAKAAATEAKFTFFSLSASTILNKYLGESEKQIQNLFELARSEKPSIIFIDEVDSLCHSRSDTASNHMDRIMTEFLIQMEGVGKDNAGVLVLGATNIPWVLDKAILRRFQKKIYIPLPDEEARVDMFRLHTRNSSNCLTEDNFKYLGSRTNGYSGSDIAVVVKDALHQPVKEARNATHFAKRAALSDPRGIGHDMWVPCSPDERGAVEMTLAGVPHEQLMVRDINMGDFDQALKRNKPTIKEEDLNKFKKFDDNCQQDG